MEIAALGIAACIALGTAGERNVCYDKICEFSTSCARKLVTDATSAFGPGSGMLVLHDLHARGDYSVTGDGHDLSHQIGRAAARVSGGSWESFLQCPDDFFLGCRHGFFEAMLGELGSSVDAASAVCAKAPAFERSFCFHGMGHGIMMANGNDVFGSVKICDELRGSVAEKGCYQGVFMENFNAAERGETRSGVLDPHDVLSPCTKVDPKYRVACFGQHAGYVLKSLSGSLASAIQACERAGKPAWTHACIQHFGQNLTTYDYQMRFLGSFDQDKAPEGVLELCNRFPEKHRDACYRGAAHNFMLYDHPELGVRFCTLIGRSWCPDIITSYLHRTMYTPEYRNAMCELFPDSIDSFECRYPTMGPVIVRVAQVLSLAVVLSALIVVFGWRSIIRRSY